MIIKPDLIIKATIGKQKTERTDEVELLDYGQVNFSRDEAGLQVQLLFNKPCKHVQ